MKISILGVHQHWIFNAIMVLGEIKMRKTHILYCISLVVLIGNLVACGKNETTSQVQENITSNNEIENNAGEEVKIQEEPKKDIINQKAKWSRLLIEDNVIDTMFKVTLKSDEDWSSDFTYYGYSKAWQEELYNAADILYCGTDSQSEKDRILEELTSVEHSAADYYAVASDVTDEGVKGWPIICQYYKQLALKYIAQIDDYTYYYGQESAKQFYSNCFASNIPYYLWTLEYTGIDHYLPEGKEYYGDGPYKFDTIEIEVEEEEGKRYIYTMTRISNIIPGCFSEDFDCFYALIEKKDEQQNVILEKVVELNNAWNMSIQDYNFDEVVEIKYDILISGNWGKTASQCLEYNSKENIYDYVSFPDSVFDIDVTYETIRGHARGSAVTHYLYAYQYKDGEYIQIATLEIISNSEEHDGADVYTSEKGTYIGEENIPQEEFDFWFNYEFISIP